MIVPDVNFLLYAFREELPEYELARPWLEEALAGRDIVGLPDVVSSGFLRVATNPRVYFTPAPVGIALEFLEDMLAQDGCFRIEPGPRHWGIFANLCRTLQLRANLVPDAYLAAIAIESGSDLITRDRGFARYPVLRWHNPLG